MELSDRKKRILQAVIDEYMGTAEPVGSRAISKKDNLGLSIHQYITKKRLALCQEAIRTKMNINEIYQTYGFGDYSSFYRAFKKEYGISPKEYRDMQENVMIGKH